MNRTATCWLVVIGLQVPAQLLLQSCKNDRPEPVKTEAQDPQRRAVFGSSPDPVSSGIRSRTSKTSPASTLDTNRSKERSRRAEPVPPKSGAQPQRPSVKDLGERRVGDDGPALALNRRPREPAAERFLHYQPPGSSVGDTGELTRRIAEPQTAPSMKPIRDLIHRWADTLLSGNLPAHMSLYAPTLDRFNGSSDVPRETVRAFKHRLLSGLKGVRRFEMYDVRLLSSRDTSVVAEFRIESDAVARDIVGWYRLELRQVGGQWKIYSEEKVQAMSKGGGR
jgi:hypothetical protein